jgi:predicted transcriptional regulator
MHSMSIRLAAASMKTLSIKVPEALAERIDQAAVAAERSRSEMIREAIEQFLIRRDDPSAGSFAAQAADLAGCLRGPEDLSFEPQHLDGYGS